jgi:PadR family transcriptional regulator PadR
MTNATVGPPWLRGVLDLCLMSLLDDGEAYGYELAARLADQGVGPVPGGSLYPALPAGEGWSPRLRVAGGRRGPAEVLPPHIGGPPSPRRDIASWRAFVTSVDHLVDRVHCDEERQLIESSR